MKRVRGLLVCGLGVLAACSSVEVVGIDSGLLDGGAPDAAAEGSSDATVKDASGQDQSADQTTEGSPDAPASEDAPGEASDDAGEAGAADSGDSGTTEAGTPDASGDAPGETGSSDEAGAEEAGEDAPSSDGAAPDAASDAPSDAAPEAGACTVAATWSMTVQTVTANPTLCQGFMDCTNCDIQSAATSSEPSAGTLDWSNLSPGGTLCNSFAGTITAGGAFATSETDCSPVGDGTTFDGQIDVATCSMTGTYVYVIGSCTVTFTMTGTQ